MSTISQAEASKPLQQRKKQECNRCKAAGLPHRLIGFEKIGEDFATGKTSWKLIEQNGVEHKHKFVRIHPWRNQQLRLHLDAEEWWI